MLREKTFLLETERLTLHPFHDIDLKDAIVLLNNNEIKETYIIPDFSTREDAVKMFDALKRMSNSDKHFVYGIYLDHKLIGFINDVDIDGCTIEVGYVINPDMKNHGYATEMLLACIQELFRMGYSVVRAGFFEENNASRRVMEKSGMTRIEKTDEIEYRGKLHHCIYYEIRK